MGFMDRAKQLAEQAQAKLDEAQRQFNTDKPSGAGTGPAVEYDQHGRPVPTEASAEPAGPPPANAAEAPAEPAGPPPASPTPPHGDPLGDAVPPAPPSTPADAPPQPDPAQPPKLSGGDPLAG